MQETKTNRWTDGEVKQQNKENLEKCLTGIDVTIFFPLSWPSPKDRKKRRKKHKYI